MSKLREYKDHSGKREWFDEMEIVNSRESLDNFFDELESMTKESHILFRGLSTSKYKLYNSSQRIFIERDLHTLFPDYVLFIRTLLDNFKKLNPAIITFFEKFKVPLNDIPFLAFMQHYGTPTPLVDWTLNPFVALFFATHNNSSTASNREIDKYFSFYCMEKFTGLSFQDKYVNFIENLNLETVKEKYKKEIDKEDLKSLKSQLTSNFTSLESFLDGPPEVVSDSKFEHFKYYTEVNFNIINQEGVFNSNPFAFIPLEEAFLSFDMQMLFKEIRNDRSDLQVEMDIILNLPKLRSEIGTSHLKPKNNIKAYEIHKSFLPLIRDYLEDKNIDQDFIYPNPIENGKKALLRTLKMK